MKKWNWQSKYNKCIFLLAFVVFFSFTCNPKENSICDPTSAISRINIALAFITKDKIPYCGVKVSPASSVASISNLKNNSIVETGFIIGTAPTSVNSVEISIDGGAYQAATGTTNWKFKLPTGSSTWKDSSKHTISTRTVTNGYLTTPYSDVVTISVRKGINKDINGDGYSDLVVGAPEYLAGTKQGKVYIFYSAGASGIVSGSATTATNTIIGEATNSLFGSVTVLSDFNGDGFADLAVGSQGFSTNQGRAYVFHSAGASGIATQAATAANSIFTGESGGNIFGAAVSVGDINGDGYTDLAIGASGYNTSQGRAYIFYSAGASGFSTASILASNANAILTGEATGDTFGTLFQMNDLNGDGFADVVIGAFAYNTYQGRLYIFQSRGSLGVASGASPTTIITGESGVTPTAFGVNSSIGDINGDGYNDLVVGAHLYPNNTFVGRVFIFHSSSSGIASMNASAANTILTAEAVSSFGINTTVVDTNGDGFGDVIVGGHTYNSNQGRTHVFQSSGSSGIATANASTAIAILSGEAAVNQQGRFLASGDFNGDGLTDLVSTSLGFNSNQGKVYIIHSTSTGLSTSSVNSSNTILTGETVGDKFGNSVY